MAKSPAGAPHADVAQPFDLRAAWRSGDRQIERDAIAFWERTAILPPDIQPEDRARELAAVAYHQDRVIGVATAQVAQIKTLRGKFAGYRCAVDPDFRRRGLAMSLTVFSRDLLEQWSLEHPEEKVLGLAAIIESPDLAAKSREPVNVETRFNLAHFLPNGRQLRVAWFAHARLDDQA